MSNKMPSNHLPKPGDRVPNRSRWKLRRPTTTMESCIVTSRFAIYTSKLQWIDCVRVRYSPGPGPVVHYSAKEFLRLHEPLT